MRAKPTATDPPDGEEVAWSFGFAQHDYLMAGRDDLGLHCGLSPKPSQQGTEHH